MDEPVAAALLLDPATQRLLAFFWANEATATEAARALGEDAGALAYRLRKLARHGLLEIARERPRAGRPSKVYRQAAEAFFVPFSATRAETLEAFLREMQRPHEERMVRSVVRVLREADAGWGVRIAPGGAGVEMRVAAGPDAFAEPEGDPVLLDFHHPALRLDPQAARDLRAELMELLGRYLARGEGRPYLLRIGLVPRGED